ncbi:High mobility group protein HMGA [Parasponia andersonii]|uniref:High mobility group protein HMGA n=1 Tax=Parasponia andersonii TaxID=3476 RepID=A0A2P5CNY4_PARAD|nr:High mobility group protein HMGA [Parasponia andersonii]
MATENSDGNANNAPPPPAPSLPQYSELIIAAVEALSEPNGSNKSAISKQIEATYGNLPVAHTTLLSHHLNRMRQSGELVLVKNNYMKPDPNAPPKRGRGRPPKPKVPLPPGAVISPPRPRGRPPKPRDPFAPPPPQKERTPGSGRPRGRPPKKAKTTPAPASSGGGEPRGRGRPPKVKPTVAPVAC